MVFFCVFAESIYKKKFLTHKYCHIYIIADRMYTFLLRPEVDWVPEIFISHYASLRAGRPRGRSSNPGGVKNFLFSRLSRPALRSTQPLIQRIPRPLSPGVKRLGREVDHSPPTNAEVEKMWIYTSTPPCALKE
jgi:hypothetical protein